MVIVMACHSGHHRADTAGNHLKDLINSVHDRHGRRLFNCQLFAVGLAANHAEAQATTTNACNWSHDAWELVAAPSPGKQHLYGYKAASCDESASQRWHQVLLARDSKFPYCDVRAMDRVVMSVSDEDTPEAAVDEGCADDVASPTVESVDGPMKASWHQRIQAYHHGRQLGNPSSSSQYETPLEAWETTDETDVRRWKSVLDELNVDKPSYKELLLLAQYSSDGKDHANQIAGKLLKKASDNEVIGNASACVHACATQARYNM